MKISLCLLTRNELLGLRATLHNIPKGFYEVFAVDGRSQDGTVEALENFGITVIPQREAGYNGAYIAAFDHFRGDAIIFFHPKGTINPQTLNTMRGLLEDGVDLVIANRNMPGASNEEDSQLVRPRKWFVLLLSALAAFRWRIDRETAWMTDVLHGYRGLSRRFVSALQLERASAVTADLEIVRHAYTTSAQVAEVPVLETSRAYGATNFPAWATGKRLLLYVLAKGK